MILREGWPSTMPAANRREPEQLLEYLRTLLPFHRAVLYGRHAGIASYNDLAGYELLLQTAYRPLLEGWQLEAAVAEDWPVEWVEQRPLHIETMRMSLVNHLSTTNRNNELIRDTGTIIYDTGRLRPMFVWEEKRPELRHARYRKLYDFYSDSAASLLDDAEWLWEEEDYALSFIQLSAAGAFLLRTMGAVFYGNFIGTDDLLPLYKRVRYFSAELAEAFPLERRFDIDFFSALQDLRNAAFCNAPRFNRYRYGYYLKRLRRMQAIVERSCQAHLEMLSKGEHLPAVEAALRTRRVQERPADALQTEFVFEETSAEV